MRCVSSNQASDGVASRVHPPSTILKSTLIDEFKFLAEFAVIRAIQCLR